MFRKKSDEEGPAGHAKSYHKTFQHSVVFITDPLALHMFANSAFESTVGLLSQTCNVFT